MRQQKGITLVALVITIIILLILAGISIATLSNSGLFDRAREAESKYGEEANKENATLRDYEQWMTNYLGNSNS